MKKKLPNVTFKKLFNKSSQFVTYVIKNYVVLSKAQALLLQ